MLNVGVIPGAVGQTWNGIPATCHFATVYYLLSAEFRREPTPEDYARLGNPTLVLRQIATMGRPVREPEGEPLVFSPGTILVFKNGREPAHSCVAKQINLLGGYNQANWFTRQGRPNDYSEHRTDEIRWLDSKSHKNKVEGNVGQECTLVQVPEIHARAKLRALYPKTDFRKR